MKIFVSHSSNQKLFVRELERRLPDFLELWVDEKEILLGDPIDETLRASVTEECDLFLLVVDEHASKSVWVAQEIEWALSREQGLGKPFLLPIVLDVSAWKMIAQGALQHKKYLSCPNFAEATLAALADSLTHELFAWLCRERSRAKRGVETPLTVLDQAEVLTREYANEIRKIVHPHRHPNPLPVESLIAKLGMRTEGKLLSRSQIETLIGKLRQSHLLDGVFFDGEVLYLSEERYSNKTGIYRGAKKRIAREAARRVESGSRIAIDGGSTTLELAKCLAEQLRARSLWDLEVLTNSLPAALELLQALNDLRAGDRDTACRVTLLGGWCRPISLTVVQSQPFRSDVEGSARSIDSREFTSSPLDACFLGTNGVYLKEGFAVRNSHEVPAKKVFLALARERFVLVDPSKFPVQQGELFASFADSLKIITCELTGFESDLESLQSLVATTPSEVILA